MKDVPGTTARPDPALETYVTTALSFASDEPALAEHLSAWQELAGAALEPNAFLEPWLVLPALRAFGADGVRFAFAYGPTNPPSKRRVLLGVFPLLPARRLSRFVPCSVIDGWKHVYGFLSTPLLHAERGGERKP
jgi:hypothetical protein